MSVCAICEHLGLAPQAATGTVGVMTDSPAIISAAIDSFDVDGSQQHVVVHACPEHVVDVYRGRIPGTRMAWKLASELAVPIRRSPSTASASPV
ncbi:MAG: hypothetical protein ABI577_12695 [bacterium]